MSAPVHSRSRALALGGRALTAVLLLQLPVACYDAPRPVEEAEASPARTYDTELCAPTPGVTADDVTSTGYDVYGPPSERAVRRYTACPLPAWASEPPDCPGSDDGYPLGPASGRTPGQAERALMRQAWCWHGVDLSVDGDVDCGEPRLYPRPDDESGRIGDFTCVVTYDGATAETGAFLVR